MRSKRKNKNIKPPEKIVEESKYRLANMWCKKHNKPFITEGLCEDCFNKELIKLSDMLK